MQDEAATGLADDESSPDRRNLIEENPNKLLNDSRLNFDDDNEKRISIQHIENTEESDDDCTLEAHRDSDDREEESPTRMKQPHLFVDLPPPLELIAKSVYREEETIKSGGAPFAFISIA